MERGTPHKNTGGMVKAHSLCLHRVQDRHRATKARVWGHELRGSLPAKFDARFLRMFFLTIPVLVSELLRRDLGSQKLFLQLKNDELAKSLSDTFLQASLYGDLKLPEYIGRLKSFRQKSRHSQIFQEILLLKMRTIFLRLGLQENEQLPFLALAAEISADIKGLEGDDRTKEIDRYTNDLRKLGRVNKLRDSMQ
jgi:hypothetical protein